jgi:hypothetical protein
VLGIWSYWIYAKCLARVLLIRFGACGNATTPNCCCMAGESSEHLSFASGEVFLVDEITNFRDKINRSIRTFGRYSNCVNFHMFILQKACSL